MSLLGFLLIENGEPYLRDCKIELSSAPTLLGREYQDYRPDISFDNPHISRRHAMITCQQGLFAISDLSSKHGTCLNGVDLIPGKQYNLHNGDIISLAKSVVTLRFSCPSMDGVTTDLTSHLNLSVPTAAEPIIIDSQRREVILEGKPVFLQGKEIELLIALYENKSRAVGYDEIRKLVWPERPEGVVPGVPDVDTSEITTLVYRLRQKLGAYGSLITTVPRYGYRLDL